MRRNSRRFTFDRFLTTQIQESNFEWEDQKSYWRTYKIKKENHVNSESSYTRVRKALFCACRESKIQGACTTWWHGQRKSRNPCQITARTGIESTSFKSSKEADVAPNSDALIQDLNRRQVEHKELENRLWRLAFLKQIWTPTNPSTYKKVWELPRGMHCLSKRTWSLLCRQNRGGGWRGIFFIFRQSTKHYNLEVQLLVSLQTRLCEINGVFLYGMRPFALPDNYFQIDTLRLRLGGAGVISR